MSTLDHLECPIQDLVTQSLLVTRHAKSWMFLSSAFIPSLLDHISLSSLCPLPHLSEPTLPAQASPASMKYLRLFGYAAQTTELLPLPSACLTTTVISNLPTTSINNSTLTYRGPLTDGFLTPFALTTTTYTTTLTTLGADGTTETQTYTIFGTPVELTRSSSLPPSPSPTGVISPGQVGETSARTSVAVSLTTAQTGSTTSGLPQSSTQPEVCRILEFTYRHEFHKWVPNAIYSSSHAGCRFPVSRFRCGLAFANFIEDSIDSHTPL
jgi:hypothetical protein